MNKVSYYAAAMRRRFDRGWFNWRCRKVLSTPPVRCDPTSNVVIVSQLYSPDVTMYLLAAKSFCRYVQPRSFTIADDGLSDGERALLAHHLGQVNFVRTKDVGSPACPRGGCWERLLTLSAQNRSHYVIQLDSDTLTVAQPREVLECIRANRSFTLGTPSGQQVVSAAEAAASARRAPHPHIQNQAEQVLDKLSDHAQLKYVRGCAGFTGFAPGDLPLTRIEHIAGEFNQLLGPAKFAQWGSEQVTSNLMAANASGACVLPVSRYPFWAPGLSTAGLALIHFFGTFRFIEGMYLKQSLRLIRDLAPTRSAA